MKPHKHAELIKAWADGAEIQRKIIRTGENIDEPIISYSWLTENMPMWSIHEEYRIKPEPKPDVKKRILYIYNNALEGKTWLSSMRVNKRDEGAHRCYMGQIEVDYET